MLIMTLSYSREAGDNSLINNYVRPPSHPSCSLRYLHIPQYKLLDQWTQFLLTDSLVPASQISTDDFAGSLANQTNLAIKGIIGIRAMGEMASLAGESGDSSNYTVCCPIPVA